MIRRTVTLCWEWFYEHRRNRRRKRAALTKRQHLVLAETREQVWVATMRCDASPESPQMDARTVDDAGERLRELRREEWQDLGLAALALGLAVVAPRVFPSRLRGRSAASESARSG